MLQGGLRQIGTWVTGPYLGARLGVATALALLFLPRFFGEPAPRRFTQEEILEAIRMTESGGQMFPPDGDGGRAIGPYQIHEIYWKDAGLPGEYQDCRDRDYAELVIEAYMQRWVPGAWRDGDAEVIARTHNGGPRGRLKKATDRYWRRVEQQLAQLP